MPTLAVTRRIGTRPNGPVQPKAALISESGRRVEFPYGPSDGDATGFGPEWIPLPRDQREPLNVKGATSLRTLTYAVTVCFQDPQRSIEDFLTSLIDMAARGERVRFTAGPAEGRSFYRLTVDRISAQDRQEGTNARTKAQVQFTLTKAVDPVSHVGPLTGGARGGLADLGVPTAVPRDPTLGNRPYTIGGG